MSDLQLLQQADLTLSKCGRPTAPPGSSYVAIPHMFLYQTAHPASTAITEAREITGDTVWMLRAISTLPPANQLYVRIQLPNGRFLSNVPRTLGQIANIGSQRYPLDRPVSCLPGSRILVTLDDRLAGGAGAITPASMLFEGVYIYAVSGTGLVPISTIQQLGAMVRYFDTPNQNIMAPEIALSLHSEATPAGYTDSPFTYLSSLLTLASTGGLASTISVNLQSTTAYCVRRLIFNSGLTGSAAGSFVCRVRDASGYSLTNDYILTSQFSNSPYACDWVLPGGSELFFDFQVVDPTGVGNYTMQVIVEGVRRKKL